ncbi:unknown [Feldmannia species virus]|uniref:Uncharacterized protein n=1 Tax=Feldmannia species virus TaxID=39420 RepID=B5LWC4_9PHYC|nr:hypothetical protein FeldSpV_gp035 [Feldmannia species virus]ACH46787.1 unknown [Feldmannia species virus]
MSGIIRSVEEIVSLSESGRTPDKMAYKYLVQQVDRLLRARALDQQHDASFEVPAMVLFQPHFNREKVAQRLFKHYENIGFACKMSGYNVNLEWGKGVGKLSTTSAAGASSAADDDETSEEDEEILEPREIIFQEKKYSASLTQRVADLKKEQDAALKLSSSLKE